MTEPSSSLNTNSRLNSKEFYVDDYPTRLKDYMLLKYNNLGDSTQLDYQRKFDHNFVKFSHLPLRDALSQTIDDLFNRLNFGEITYSTFRIYRASICFGVASFYEQWRLNKLEENQLSQFSLMVFNELYQKAIKKVEEHAELRNVDTKVYETSSLKAKRFDQSFYLYLIRQPKEKENLRRFNNNKKLNNLDFTYSGNIKVIDLLRLFVKANMLVGLRPIEWLGATLFCNLETKSLQMNVINAKNTHGRANGESRTLCLNDITDTNSQFLLDYLVLFNIFLEKKVLEFLVKQNEYSSQNSFFYEQSNGKIGVTVIPISLEHSHTRTYLKNVTLEQMVDDKGVAQAGCANKVYRAMQNEMSKKFNEYMRSIGQEITSNTKRPTLYSTRHQCIANAKKDGKNPFEIAGFFGHASPETNRMHYGKASYAWTNWGKFTFDPALESILLVKNGLEYLEKSEKEYYSIEQNRTVTDVENESLNIYDKRSQNNDLS